MRDLRKTAIGVLVALCLAGLDVAPAQAELGPIQLVSKSATEQADSATEPAISADGRFVVFQATIGGLKGVFRKELETGSLRAVVAGDAYAPGATGADAKAPSISADGRYVSFTTSSRLDPTNDLQATSSDVYVADMGASPPSYELASAIDGSQHGLTYTGSGGAVASGRVSLSGNGRKVVFVTTAAANLTGAAGGTPKGQVVLRDLDAQRTTIVSQTMSSLGGAPQPVPGGAVSSPAGAALSADGTTVAWLGVHLPAQVPLLSDEAQAITREDNGGFTPYDEPLWRRVADGPAAPTRRIIGGGDPLAPGCPPGGTLAVVACQGPFLEMTKTLGGGCESQTGWFNRDLPAADHVPQLSADGRTVALIGEQPDGFANVFAVDMDSGLSRLQALRQLTREVPLQNANSCVVSSSSESIAIAGDVLDLAISPDGGRIAFVTARQQFPLAPPNLIGSAPSALGLTELYRIDLGSETLERITGGPNGTPSLRQGGGPGAAGAFSPSFGADGHTLAFASQASNLVGGDANGESDVFVVSDESFLDLPGSASVSAPPPPLRLKPRWRLAVSAISQADGSLRLAAVVPGAGTLRARAGAAVGPRLRMRSVAAARGHASADGPLALELNPAPRFRRLSHSKAGIDATLHVFFSGPGGKPLKDTLEVRFHASGGKHGKGTR